LFTPAGKQEFLFSFEVNTW